MKNTYLVILLTAVITALAVRFIAPTTTTAAQPHKETAYARVMRTGVLRCGYNVWPPAVMVDPKTNKVTGIIPELVEEAAKAVNLKVEWTQQVGWGTFAQDLKNGRYDAMCAGAWEMKEVAPLVSFSQPIFYNPVYAWVRSDDTRFDNGLSILNNPAYRIATVDGDMSDIAATTDFPKAQKVSHSQSTSTSDELLDVLTKKADVAFMEPSSVRSFLKERPNALKRVGTTPYRSFSSPLISTEIHEHELIRMFNTVIDEMQLQGVIQKTIDKYETDRSFFVPVAKPYDHL